MFLDCLMVVVMWDQNTWNTIPISEQKIHWIFKHWIVEHWIKQKHWMNKSGPMKLAIDKTGAEWLSVFRKCWIVTAQYLLRLNIFVIMELTIATLFCGVLVHGASVVVLLNSIFFQQAHSWPFGKFMELTRTLCGLMSNLQSSTSWIP